MSTATNSPRSQPARPAGAGQPRYRSGAVARMLRMPVATLRIWERRYRVAAPATTASGHRLYSAEDVQRLALLRQLTDLGHAIGALAKLSVSELREVAATHAEAVAGSRQAPAPLLPWRVIAIGSALVQRLQRPSLQRRLRRPIEVLATHESMQTARATAPTGPADAVLLRINGLHDSSLADIEALREHLGVRRVAVMYGYAAQPVLETLAGHGVKLLHEQQDDLSLADWLQTLSAATTSDEDATLAPNAEPLALRDLLADMRESPSRRYDDDALVEFAGLSTTIACECPRHVSDILIQVSRFETYSAECASRSPADAALHSYLQRVAAASRALFETALERLAMQEGLMLPR